MMYYGSGYRAYMYMVDFRLGLTDLIIYQMSSNVNKNFDYYCKVYRHG